MSGTVQTVVADGAFKAPANFSHARVFNGIIYNAGQIPLDTSGQLVANTIESQTKQVIENHEAILKAAGSGLDRILRINVYLTETADYAGFSETYNALIPDPKPARACVFVKSLPASARVEMDLVAATRAGGMARAAIYACLRMGLGNIMLWNRTKQTAEIMTAHFEHVADKLQSERLGRDKPPSHLTLAAPTILINALPDGEHGEIASNFDVPSFWFSHSTGGIYIESAYKTQPSRLMNTVVGLQSRKWVGINGKQLLLEQALPQIELWTGLPAPRESMQSIVI
ncbi:hypothetical protein KCU64_g5251, partial [Aureobasidium melanogenum]